MAYKKIKTNSQSNNNFELAHNPQNELTCLWCWSVFDCKCRLFNNKEEILNRMKLN